MLSAASSSPRVPITPAIALGFLTIGFMSLIAVMGILLAQPTIVLGDPYRMEFLGFGTFIILGFVAPCIFAAGYILSPIMASESLFSARLASLHLLLHSLGFGWLLLVFGGMDFLDYAQSALFAGLGVILAGTGLFILNLLATASYHNRWDPEQLTLMASLFWLGLATLLGLTVLIPGDEAQFGYEASALMQFHAPLGLVGFLWLSMIGFTLKLFSMLLVSEKRTGKLSWAGLVIINGTLLAIVPLTIAGTGQSERIIAFLLLAGSLFYLADFVRLWVAAQRPLDSALGGAFIGLLSGLVLMGWSVAGMPLGIEAGPGTGERVFFLLGVLGVFAFVILSLFLRLIPFMIWQLRCAPFAGKQAMPNVDQLYRSTGGTGMVICLLIAGSYLAAGQWYQIALSAEIASIGLITAVFWFLWTVWPALRVFIIGIVPRN